MDCLSFTHSRGKKERNTEKLTRSKRCKEIIKLIIKQLVDKASVPTPKKSKKKDRQITEHKQEKTEEDEASDDQIKKESQTTNIAKQAIQSHQEKATHKKQ
jgi:hypothetical protein